jgi:ATP:ADP antiporter, AAA family
MSEVGLISGIAAYFKALVPSTNRREQNQLLCSALCFFFVLTSYYIIRPIRDQFAAAAGGSQALPMLFTWVFAAMLLLTPLYGLMVSKYSRRVFVPITYVFFVACLLAMGPLFRYTGDLGLNAKIFFVWVSVFNLFVVSVFWSCMSDVFDSEQAKRMYGAIAIGGTAGAFFGPFFTTILVGRIGLEGLYLTSAGILTAALLCLLVLFTLAKAIDSAQVTHDQQAIGGGVWEGIQTTLSHPLMRKMVLLLLCGDGVATILYSKLSDYAKERFATAAEQAAFFATIDAWTNFIPLVLQVLLVPWMLRKFGAGRTMALPNILVAAALILFAFLLDPSVIAVAMVMTRGGTFGILIPAKESLFTRVDRSLRFKAKGFLDTFVWRGGDLIVVNIVAFATAHGAGLASFCWLAALCALTAVGLSWNVEKLLPKGKDVGAPLP